MFHSCQIQYTFHFEMILPIAFSFKSLGVKSVASQCFCNACCESGTVQNSLGDLNIKKHFQFPEPCRICWQRQVH